MRNIININNYFFRRNEVFLKRIQYILEIHFIQDRECLESNDKN